MEEDENGYDDDDTPPEAYAISQRIDERDSIIKSAMTIILFSKDLKWEDWQSCSSSRSEMTASIFQMKSLRFLRSIIRSPLTPRESMNKLGVL